MLPPDGSPNLIDNQRSELHGFKLTVSTRNERTDKAMHGNQKAGSIYIPAAAVWSQSWSRYENECRVHRRRLQTNECTGCDCTEGVIYLSDM